MELCFVLPQILRKPIGGYKIVYEYANRLVKRGYNVSILFINDNALEKYHLPEAVRLLCVRIITSIEPRWFKLDKNIRKLSTTDVKLSDKIQNINLAIATGVDTVDTLLSLFPNQKKSYFIQDYEKWVYDEERIIRTYRDPIDKIVISSWLKNIVDKYSDNKSLLIKNPIDTGIYKCYKHIDERYVHSLGVLYHVGEHKGFRYSYEAILKLKEKYPDLKVKMFGTSVPDFRIPDWMEFTLNATKEKTIEIYNEVSVFICSTINEGFGLTGLEAMSCGAVLVSSDYPGVREYATNEVNSLLSAPKDVNGLVSNVVSVFENRSLRRELSTNGIKQAETMT